MTADAPPDDPGRRRWFFKAELGAHSDRRFVWLPDVHQAYNERCYYFLISAPDTSHELHLHQQLRELLTAVDISSYSLYFLHGTFDALLRVWASDAAILRLMPALQAVATDDIMSFEVAGVEYLSLRTSPRLTRAEIRQQMEYITEVTTREDNNGWPLEIGDLPPPITRLLTAGLIAEIPPPKFPDGSLGLKFYSYLERRQTLRTQTQHESELRGLRRALQGDQIQVPSIYLLKNDKGYLVKGVAPSFQELRESLVEIYSFCLERGFRIQTFPLPNMEDAVERDFIDSSVRDESWQSENVVETLAEIIPNARTYLGALVGENRGLFTSFLRENGKMLQDRETAQDLATLLEAVAVGDTRAMARSLSFVLEIEELLRQTVWLLVQEELGASWRSHVEAALARTEARLPGLANLSETTGTPFDEMALQDIVVLLGTLGSRTPSLRLRTAEVLTEKWRERIAEIRALRNEIAHGRFRGAIDKQGETLAVYLNAALFRFTLDRFISVNNDRSIAK